MDLEERFRAFWRRARAAGDPAASWAGLERRWSEPHRAYHALPHLAHCLDELDGARDLADDPLAVELALWCHDAVYDTRAQDNELRSAELAADLAILRGFLESPAIYSTERFRARYERSARENLRRALSCGAH